MIDPPPASAGRGWSVIRLSPDDRVALMIGHGACLIIGGDRFQNLQNLSAVGALTQEGQGEVLSHARMLVCGLVAESLGALPFPFDQGAK